MKIEGIITAFNKTYVTIQNEQGQKTKVPRHLLQDKIATGEFIRIVLTEKQILDLKKLNAVK